MQSPWVLIRIARRRVRAKPAPHVHIPLDQVAGGGQLSSIMPALHVTGQLLFVSPATPVTHLPQQMERIPRDRSVSTYCLQDSRLHSRLVSSPPLRGLIAWTLPFVFNFHTS